MREAMGFWNYRVVRRRMPEGELIYAVHQAHYEDDQRDKPPASRTPWSVTDRAVRLEAESMDGICEELILMSFATKLPVLDYETRKPVTE
jgi:hypothetical protein